jgi:chromosome segregation ATPase
MKTLLPILLAGLVLPLSAQTISPSEQRLRETLRTTMLQLRAVQGENANLQADKIQNEAKIQELQAEVERLGKQITNLNKEAGAEREASQKTIDELRTKGEAQDRQIAQLKEALEKWKSGYADAVRIAKEREALRAKAASRAVLAERKLAERERQNLELYETGSEILDRLKSFRLGTALSAREPFVGTTRVKLQTLVQDYSDRLQDNKYNPFAKEGAEAPPPTPAKPDTPASQP